MTEPVNGKLARQGIRGSLSAEHLAASATTADKPASAINQEFARGDAGGIRSDLNPSQPDAGASPVPVDLFPLTGFDGPAGLEVFGSVDRERLLALREALSAHQSILAGASVAAQQRSMLNPTSEAVSVEIIQQGIARTSVLLGEVEAELAQRAEHTAAKQAEG